MARTELARAPPYGSRCNFVGVEGQLIALAPDQAAVRQRAHAWLISEVLMCIQFKAGERFALNRRTPWTIYSNWPSWPWLLCFGAGLFVAGRMFIRR